MVARDATTAAQDTPDAGRRTPDAGFPSRIDRAAVFDAIVDTAAAVVVVVEQPRPVGISCPAAEPMTSTQVAHSAMTATHVAVVTTDDGVGGHLEHPCTPHRNSKEESKPVVGMIFETLTDVENFYKSYAHDAGFSVRIGQQKKQMEEVIIKRYLCSREGYRKEDNKNVSVGKKKKTHNVMETRCGCPAHIVVNLGSDKKYRIASMVEEHNHGFVSPDKRHLLRSNRFVSERAKTTLFNCHKASIGTSQAYRLLHVSDGGFQNVGCTLQDLKNYYRDLRNKIKDADAQMFIAQLERKNEVNPAFFYDFMVDEQGRLVRVFWAYATSRKNYSVFGDVLSVDATYSTNQYNMKFVPFTGVNHHLQSVFLGAGFLANEKIDSYVWLFQTFLKAMGGVAPHLIITDEDASMKAAISHILSNTVHRFCMWHIMEKVPEKAGPSIRKDDDFWDRLNKCVWGSENSDEFESEWNSILEVKFQMKSIYIHQVISHPKGDAKEYKRARRRSLQKKRRCGKCKQEADHDARNCPNNVVGS